jgi:hypothetical protein
VTLEDVSNLSQAIAALAVVVSLVYAALQFRIYAKAAREARVIAVMSDIQEFRKIIATDADCARIFREGLRDPASLAAPEAWRFGALMQMLITNVHLVGEFPDVFKGGPDSIPAWVFQRPGFRQWWIVGRSGFAPPTVAMVERLMHAAEATTSAAS